jgi:excisionase family DNA binding protein
LAHKLTLSLVEAAQLSGLSRGHLRFAIAEKKLKARIIGRGWRVKREDLEAYIKKL